MAFELYNDMGGLRAVADSALELRDQLPFDGKLKANGLFIAHKGKKLTKTEFEHLCQLELSANTKLNSDRS